MLDFSQGLEPPYLTSELEGIGGRLRATVDDFIVEEIPLYEPVDEGQHLYVRLTKAGLTTKDVEHQLKRLFQLPKGAVGFAGMKDKHATTTQTFSLNVGHQQPEFAAEAAARIEEALPVQVAWARFHQNKLRAGHLLGNRFRITIRDIDLSPTETLARATAIVDRIRATGLPNYFGPQRFGHDGGNLAQGLAVLRGERFIKDKWRRRFLVSAYQSFLCNCYLGVRIERQAFLNLLDGDVAKKYATGGMFDVEDVTAEQLRYAAHEISFTAPMYGAKMREAQEAAGALEAEPATLIESGWAATWMARLTAQLATPPGLRERWFLELLASQRTCVIGGVGVEPSPDGPADAVDLRRGPAAREVRADEQGLHRQERRSTAPRDRDRGRG